MLLCAATLVCAQAKKESDKITCPFTPKGDVTDDTKAALACEWIDPKGVSDALQALGLLTTPTPKDGCKPTNTEDCFLTPHEAAKAALCKLIEGAPGNSDLYTADKDDPDLLDNLAKANTLGLKAPDDEDGLFKKAGTLVDAIYSQPGGKQALAKVNESFVRKDNHVALFRLLDAYKPADPKTLPTDLEILRAAFEMNTDRLAKLVANKKSAAKN
jgi:hypothetical protein